ncbi:hypothetical protein SASPL_114509 [Salvia splendens]|uniref:C2H2-type domain-containing protein n=1 Tax=Salvia splendens TaxID=180675 RepID=A0A8X8ZZF0_SALSN|nr:uncharacterized protein LOC121802488 [Salvia splendens]KAG6424097.1 hypothetical protein SASPL_114509 [Salvia splendens]
MPTLIIHIATIMPTTIIRSLFSNLFLLFFHLACFTFSSLRHHSPSSLLHKKRSPPNPNPKSTLFSYLKRLFTPSAATHVPPPPSSIPSPSSSTRSLRLNPPLIAPINTRPHHHHTHAVAPADIHPCTVCGELFQTPASLHHHQSSKHGVSDLPDGDNIIRIIFTTGWPHKPPAIHRILKIHNTPRVLARFEDHRDRVKSDAAADGTKSSRCVADGNELLRFYCTTFLCSLDSAICSHQFCGACAIIRYGFSKKLSGIHTLPTAWKAHAAVPEDVEEEFSFMHVKRAMLVCRVIAGRVGTTLSDVDKDHAFDSLVGPGDDDLLVFSPKAVLPCFVIVYTL